MKKIVIVEDDKVLQQYIHEYILASGYQAISITTFTNVVEQVVAIQPDLILLDINLPMFDGFFYTKLLRKQLPTPIIILSARSDESEQIRGIQNGADDYITKPFSIGVLLAKIEAIFRRSNIQSNSITSGDITLNSATMRIDVNKITIDLSKNEFKLLHYFLQQPNEIIARETLLMMLWDDEQFVDDNTLSVNMTRLKHRLKDAHSQAQFITKRGVGYIFIPTTT